MPPDSKPILPMKISSLLAVSILGLAFTATRASADDKVDFEKQILPILKTSCFKCHEKEHTDETGKLKKPKGGLVLNTPEGIKKGGKEDGDKVCIAGKGAESTLYKSTTLPESDDKAMPPEGKGDRVSKENQELLKKWIDGGADFGAWKGSAK
jgi:uncharacterized membrane protein